MGQDLPELSPIFIQILAQLKSKKITRGWEMGQDSIIKWKVHKAL